MACSTTMARDARYKKKAQGVTLEVMTVISGHKVAPVAQTHSKRLTFRFALAYWSKLGRAVTQSIDRHARCTQLI